jgi:hypothetical protein
MLSANMEIELNNHYFCFVNVRIWVRFSVPETGFTEIFRCFSGNLQEDARIVY